MFLTIEEIQRLTGLKRPSAQISWLKDHGYRFTVNGLNQPIVAIAEVTRKLVGGSAVRKQEGPRWETMLGQTPKTGTAPAGAHVRES